MTELSDMTDAEYAQHLDKSSKVLKGLGQENISAELYEASCRIKHLIEDNKKLASLS